MSQIMLYVASMHMAVSASAIAQTSLPTLFPGAATMSAEDIMRRTHGAAGGDSWVKPKSLMMSGYAVFYKDGAAVKNEAHNMWRIYDRAKTAAHKADGKVRIESRRGGQAIINISYDGAVTYTSKGPQPASAADARWASAFGFGVARHAFDPGYTLERLPDDLVDGRRVFTVKIATPLGGYTNFYIDQENYRILKIGFKTPRGWHERIYSNFFKNPDTSWVQPGRVRLYYNGVKANEVIWESFQINQQIPDCLFVLPEAKDCRPAAPAARAKTSSLHADMAELLSWFPGTYDNHQQVYGQAKDKVAPALRQRHTNHIFRPLKIPGIPGHTLYAQQSQHYDADDLYRQRIYSFAVDEAEQAIRLTIYTPKNPSQLTNAHLDSQKIAGLTADDFFLKPGCDVFWRKGEGQFDGFLKAGACSYVSRKFKARVFLDETLILRRDALILHDRAVDAEGKLIFGSADKGPTINLKIAD